jgi:cytochrome P450/bacterioferritin-associated ferredoxin
MTDSTDVLEQFLPTAEDDDIVCHCVHVTGDTIRAALQRGVTTFTRLQETTGCGSVCGGCEPEIAGMLDSKEWEWQAAAGDCIQIDTFTSAKTPKVTREEREAFQRYVLVTPRPASKPLSRILRRLGKILHSAGNTRFNPFRWLEDRIVRAMGADPALPVEYLAMVSALSRGPYEYKVQGFKRLTGYGAANRRRTQIARSEGLPLRPDTPDGDTFVYWVPAPPFPKFPPAYRVDTGWDKASDRKMMLLYVTRSRTAIELLLRRADDTDRGALPYHFLQQIFGRTDVVSCPGRKASGLFGGALHDNATWTEDRALTANLFGFASVDAFGPGMAAAAEQTCTAIDGVITRNPDAVIDLNVMLSKVAYTIIVRAIFGNVGLDEMHALGRILSESIRKTLDYVMEFVLGRQSVPHDYVKHLEGARLAMRRIVDLLRELGRQGKLSEDQSAVPVVRLILDTAEEPGGGYDKLYALILPVIIGGHETTGHAMTWAFYELARNRELERQVLDETEAFREAHGGRPISSTDYDERPMAWALLAECLRRHTPLAATSRTTLREGTVPPDPRTGIGGFRFPAGAMVVFSIVGVHLDPARWVDPYAFQPGRWFEGVRDDMNLVEKGRAVRANIRSREQAIDWIPFSDGPGRCVGQHFNAHEFFVILDALLPRYRFELVNPGDEVSHNENIVMGPEQGRMAVRIRRRY